MLNDHDYRDLKKAIAACTLTNISLLLPAIVIVQMFIQLMKPLMGEAISWNTMWVLFALGILAALVVFFANKHDYEKTYVASYMQSENTRITMAEHIRKLPMSLFNSKDLSALTTNLMGDVATSEHVLSHVIPQLFANAISVTIICVMLAFFEWRMALAIFITVPLAFFIIYVAQKIAGKLSKKHVAAKLEASAQVQEYIEGIKVIRACNLDGEQFTTLEKALHTMMDLAIKMELATGVFVTGAQVVLQAGIGFTVLLGTTLLTGGQIELLPMLMFLVIVVRIYGPIIVMLTLLPELLYHQICIKRMRDLMAVEPMKGDTEKKITEYTITFEDVDFQYNKGGAKTIQNFNATIPSGAITALVGPSGSGKSTISRLIARFWDIDKGRITIGGIDVSLLDPENLMQYMSFVFQDVTLFNDTVYNNIRIGNMLASEQEVMEAAKAASCDEFVQRLPQGYETMLGENGLTLSGGERQRLSIARALLKDAPIVLLDEATASLDPENEALIQKAIHKLIQNKTVVVIAHRLRTIAEADHIIVLDEGRVSEQGTHKELMKNKGLYEKLFSLQQKSQGWSVGI
ncbi:MAG: ABC transporter ATP-binding protein [Sphaerochaeta sp.]|nr:ABC transporter ATP-binding protein [Sphaerochaeta sp.]